MVIATRSVARPDTYDKRHEGLAPIEGIILLLRTFNLLVTKAADQNTRYFEKSGFLFKIKA